MRYRMREGLVIESVCGKPLLAATQKVRKHCPYLTELNESSLYVLEMVKKEMDTDEMVQSITENYEISEEKAWTSLKSCLDQLLSSGFIIPLIDDKHRKA